MTLSRERKSEVNLPNALSREYVDYFNRDALFRMSEFLMLLSLALENRPAMKVLPGEVVLD